MPTEEEAQGLIDSNNANKIDILFAHDALRGTALQRRLLANRHLWREDGLGYAESAADLFTERALTVLSESGMVVSGHYHLRHSADEVLTRPDGTLVRARSEVLSAEWDDGAVGLLDAQTLSVETWAVDPENARVNYSALHTKPSRKLSRSSREIVAPTAVSWATARPQIPKRHLPSGYGGGHHSGEWNRHQTQGNNRVRVLGKDCDSKETKNG